MHNYTEQPKHGYSKFVEKSAGALESQDPVYQRVNNLLSSSVENGFFINIYGEKGSGKTFLLRKIQEEYLNSTHLAYSNLSAGHCGQVLMNESVAALMHLRSHLSRNYFFCPLFDLVIASYLYQKGVLNRVNLREYYHPKDRVYLIELWELMEKQQWQNLNTTILSLIESHLKAKFSEYCHFSGLNENTINQCLQADADNKIPQILPEILATEINASVRMPTTPQKALLLFDNYPLLVQSQIDTSKHLVQKWLVPFLRKLSTDYGICIVISSNQQLNLKNDVALRNQNITSHAFQLSEASLMRHPDLGLSWQRHFPEHMHIFDFLASQQTSLTPYQFGVCQDILHTKLKNSDRIDVNDFSPGESHFRKSSFFMRKLLQISGRENAYSLIALSAARYFDWSMYTYLADHLNFEATQPSFDNIIQYSFTEKLVLHSQTYYRFYTKAVIDIQTYSTKVLAETHRILEAYYRMLHDQGNRLVLSDAIYHLSKINVEKGVVKWLKAFEYAYSRKDFLLLYALLDIISQIDIEDHFWRGQIQQSIAAFYRSLGLYKYTMQSLQTAQDNFDEHLKQNPEDLDTLNSKGVVIFSRGDVLQQSQGCSHSTSSYAEAMIYFTEILQKNQSFVAAQFNSALINIKQAMSYSLNDQSEERIKRFENAHIGLETILKMSPGYLPALKVFALLQLKLAREYMQQGNDEKVLSCIAVATEVFEHKHANSSQLNGLLPTQTDVYKEVALIESDYGYYYDADEHFRTAIAAANLNVEHEQGITQVLQASEILMRYAAFQIKYMQLTGALSTATQAENSVKSLYWANPKNCALNNALGFLALQKADIYKLEYNFSDAHKSCELAIDYFSNSLWFDDQNVGAKTGRALVAAHLASMAAQCADFSKASLEFEESIALFGSLAP
ncbi:hypothetical protein KC799_19980, partial [candidate division KSB1 bacterium]|nr:hypothetical protein [candidate division KSB1 bacterium]